MVQIMYLLPKKNINQLKTRRFRTYFEALKFISNNIDKVVAMNITFTNR